MQEGPEPLQAEGSLPRAHPWWHSQGLEGTGGLLQPPMSLRPLRDPQPPIPAPPEVLSTAGFPSLAPLPGEQALQLWPVGSSVGTVHVCPQQSLGPTHCSEVQLMQPGP